MDLTGQVCSDSIGTRLYSGFGGQVDFIRGAAQIEGGKPIIALPSTAKNGSLSRIAPTLNPGAGVVTSRADVHYVVTEHGVAYLHGNTLRQRAEALISHCRPGSSVTNCTEFAARLRYLGTPPRAVVNVRDFTTAYVGEVPSPTSQRLRRDQRRRVQGLRPLRRGVPPEGAPGWPPPESLRLSSRPIIGHGCTGCGLCFYVCPEPGAIKVFKRRCPA